MTRIKTNLLAILIAVAGVGVAPLTILTSANAQSVQKSVSLDGITLNTRGVLNARFSFNGFTSRELTKTVVLEVVGRIRTEDGEPLNGGAARRIMRVPVRRLKLRRSGDGQTTVYRLIVRGLVTPDEGVEEGVTPVLDLQGKISYRERANNDLGETIFVQSVSNVRAIRALCSEVEGQTTPRGFLLAIRRGVNSSLN